MRPCPFDDHSHHKSYRSRILRCRGAIYGLRCGVEWRVVLDPQTSLPKTMAHQEGERTITVTFVAYETVNGIKFEKEIHRSAGDPSRSAVIRFTKTVINPPVESSLFSTRAE